MTQRTKNVEILREYFREKGGVLSPREYRKQRDFPIRPAVVKRIFGSWGRMESIIKRLEEREAAAKPVSPEAKPVEPVKKPNNEESI